MIFDGTHQDIEPGYKSTFTLAVHGSEDVIFNDLQQLIELDPVLKNLPPAEAVSRIVIQRYEAIVGGSDTEAQCLSCLVRRFWMTGFLTQ